MGVSSPPPVCVDSGFDTVMDPAAVAIMQTHVGMDGVIEGLESFVSEGISVGSTTALIMEASDAAVSGATIEDGQSGDIDFPFGKIKAIATVSLRLYYNDISCRKSLYPQTGVSLIAMSLGWRAQYLQRELWIQDCRTCRWSRSLYPE